MKNKKLQKIAIWGLIFGMTFEAAPVWALTKEETIYTKLNSDGSTKEVVVSEHLSDYGDSSITDKSRLENIVNVGGDETYTTSNGNIVWETNGKDIYYQGTTKEEMPIGVQLKYYLDGKEKNLEDMIGKSGKVKIVISYENKLKHTVTINGKTEVLYTPFVIATTTILSNDSNKNIRVSNGKIVDNGMSSIVVALASPGLYDSLGIEPLKSLDTIELSYETDCFELSSIYSVATPKLLEESDLEIFDDLDSLYSSIETLSDSSKALVKGSEQLVTGSSSLKEGTSQIVSGIDSAYAGSQTISSTVKSSIENLQKDTSSALDENTLNYVIESAKQGATLSEAQKKAIGEQAVQSVKASESYQKLEQEYNKYASAISTLEAAYAQASQAGAIEQADAYKVQLDSATQAATTYKTMMNIMEETARETAISTATQVSVSVASEVSKNVAIQVADTAKQTFTQEVVSSLSSLLGGLDQLNTGLGALKEGSKTLYDGTATLADGIETLHVGLETFDSEGIDSIVSLVNGDVKSLETKLEKMIDYSQSYQTLDDATSSTEGSSKIIMIIDAVKSEEEKEVNSEKIVEEKKSFKQKIKGLFVK